MNQNKSLTVWIFQTGEPIHLDEVNARGMRAINLSDELVSQGHQVVLWTSDFDHFSKTSRFGKATTIDYSNLLSIKLIPSNGYRAHKSLIRFWDHLQLAYNLRKMLRDQIPPDVAFVGLPPVEAAWVMSRWLKKNQIPFMLDIKDTWPENYANLFPQKIRLVGNFVFAPLFSMRNWTLRNADGVVSITKDFLNWARLVSKTNRKEFDHVAPLVPNQRKYSTSEELAAEDWLDENNVLNDGRTRAYFVGSLNDVFDFEPIFFAAKNSATEFVICGEGPLRETLENQFKTLSNVVFLGWVNQTQSDALARRSTFALAPVRDRADFNMSIPNKFFDAIRLAKPIIATDHGVAADFIKSNGIGVCYRNTDSESLAKTIESLLINPKNLNEMSKNAEALFQITYNPSKVYGDLVIRLADLSSAMCSLEYVKNAKTDKDFEIRKYDEFASNEMAKGNAFLGLELPLDGIHSIHTPPYSEYISQLNNLIRSHHKVLELGAGTGKITTSLVSIGADITAIDISAESLHVLRVRSNDKIKTVLADIESLPFEDSFFDFVISSGSLSYGVPSLVDHELRRVLKPQGSIIILDSLNHNPIYRINRLVSFLRGKRTRSSIETIPNLGRVEGLARLFESSKVLYFGHYLWIHPLLRVFTPRRFADRVMMQLNRMNGPRKMAFKFVLIGERFKK